MSGPLAYSARDQTEAAPCVEPGKAVIRKISEGQSLGKSGSSDEGECNRELGKQIMEEVQRPVWRKINARYGGRSTRLIKVGRAGHP